MIQRYKKTKPKQASGYQTQRESKTDSPDVIVLQSGRLRGNVYPAALQNLSPLQHYAYLAGYVKKVREEAAAIGSKVVVVDLGDSLGGSVASHATSSGNMVAFFNETGCDFIVLGNLDNTIPSEAISRLTPKVLCPFAASDGRPATASKFFASLLTQELRLPAGAIRDAAAGSEFDYFASYLTNAPQPPSFGIPGGWIH